MRQFFSENDVIVTEVNRIQPDGALLLHTRNARYGKLKNGCMVRVPASLVQRQQQHMVDLSQRQSEMGGPLCNVTVVLGNNGTIWVGAESLRGESEKDSLNYVYQAEEDRVIRLSQRTDIARVRNCIVALAHHFIEIDEDGIVTLFQFSIRDGLNVWDMLLPEVVSRLVDEYIITKVLNSQ
eukprot:GHVN01010745.1.p1 GENE.GHVN01010745.1~~GHVN01010745.1.p1  ORF type:complete len:181 (+),score=20.87 GHVN01010745.1:1498-2040(+)